MPVFDIFTDIDAMALYDTKEKERNSTQLRLILLHKQTFKFQLSGLIMAIS